MKTVLPSIYDDDQRGFDNVFDRKRFAVNLQNLFRNSENGLVIMINSDWGEGKTTFIKMWEKELKAKDEFIPIYYDAFINDFTGDAFMSIAASIQHALEENKSKFLGTECDAQFKAFKDNAWKFAKNMAKTGVGVAVQSLTGGIIKSDDFQKAFKDGVSELLICPFEANKDEIFKEYNDSQNLIRKFKNAFEEILCGESNNKRKIILFIDELDRCRPDFALEILEKIKHLFSVKNAYFVLAINKKQLISTIKHVYGDDVEASVYLQKFIHLETSLPTIRETPLGKTSIRKFIEGCINELKINIEPYQIDQNIINVLLTFSDINSPNSTLTPRSIERILTYVAVAVGSCDSEKISVYLKHFTPMAILKTVRNQKDYICYRNGVLRNPNDETINSFDKESNKIFNFLLNHYGINPKSGAEYPVRDLKEACDILDIYTLPNVR